MCDGDEMHAAAPGHDADVDAAEEQGAGLEGPPRRDPGPSQPNPIQEGGSSSEGGAGRAGDPHPPPSRASSTREVVEVDEGERVPEVTRKPRLIES